MPVWWCLSCMTPTGWAGVSMSIGWSPSAGVACCKRGSRDAHRGVLVRPTHGDTCKNSLARE
eukprot:236093-Chlamydomonas_euryale.AAC.1